jgi:hypothetical protein
MVSQRKEVMAMQVQVLQVLQVWALSEKVSFLWS